MKNGKPYKIEDNIPIPRGRGVYGQITEVLGKLEIGQSVLFPQYDKCEQLGGIRAAVQGRLNIRIVTRKVEGGVRVWRVS